MPKVVLVGLGGFIGSVARYALGGWVHGVARGPVLPYGTLVVNVLGCLLIGFLTGLPTPRLRSTMTMLPEEGRLLRIFVAESDKHEGAPLYEWIVRKAREHGLATVEKVQIRFYRSGAGPEVEGRGG